MLQLVAPPIAHPLSPRRLAAFRRDAAAWGVALDLLRLGAAGVPPEVRLQAAALLAWKCKRQLSQLQPVERQAELAEALTALAADGGQQQQDVALRGVCVALANLAIQCSSWAAPLEMLGEQSLLPCCPHDVLAHMTCWPCCRPVPGG